jgi:transposase-like protein
MIAIGINHEGRRCILSVELAEREPQQLDLERFNEEIKRRTLVVRIFPNEASCLRLVRALAVEMHENWIEATRYLNMELLAEHKKQRLREVAA